ncbi:hypothetical protein MKZ38_002618 [Zalerion maritima]|uniref:Xaa-Pro aminopeptidase n=1 Tax=Zalerion maritima TaxID=339359 RepID=A0AAD5RY59_9PEZI|nr:hypothetical protein MKZ38_002618 [Zalerion maritima]
MDETYCNFDAIPVDEFDALSIRLTDGATNRCSKEVLSKYPAMLGNACLLCGPFGWEDHGAVGRWPFRPHRPMFHALEIHPSVFDFILLPKLHAKKVVKELGSSNGIVYLAGEVEKTYEYSDMGPVFRQRRYFFYLTGANFSGCAVTHHIRHDELILWIPTVDPKQVLWYGRIPTAADCSASSDVDDVRDIADLPKYIARNVNKYTPLYVLNKDASSLPPLPEGSPHARAGWSHHDAFPSTMWRYMAGISRPAGGVTGQSNSSRKGVPYNATALRPAMDEARVMKTPYEIAAIRKANEISSAAHAAVCRFFDGMETERDAEGVFLRECVRRGGKNQAYPVIAGSGINAATLHYEQNDDTLDGKQMMVLDAGCEWNCYASDITRTLPIGGAWPSQEARDIYAIVDRMQSQCIERVKPGKIYYELHILAHQIVLAELMRLRIIKGPGMETMSEEERVHALMAKGVTSAFFPHGLGHHVGLETHDLPGKEKLLLTMNRTKNASGRRGKRSIIPPEEMVEMYLETRPNVDSPGENKAKETNLPFEDDKSARWKNMTQQATSTPGMTSAPPPYDGRQALKPGMIVTIEPGIYFCREYIEGYFLSNPKLGKYIDEDVLERYYPVGGVRIEDDILVTEDGYENLTTAPRLEVGGG